jgi:hypothetical protein
MIFGRTVSEEANQKEEHNFGMDLTGMSETTSAGQVLEPKPKMASL